MLKAKPSRHPQATERRALMTVVQRSGDAAREQAGGDLRQRRQPDGDGDDDLDQDDDGNVFPWCGPGMTGTGPLSSHTMERRTRGRAVPSKIQRNGSEVR